MKIHLPIIYNVCTLQVDCFDESDENYLLCGYPESGRPPPTTTTTTTVRPSYSHNKDIIIFELPQHNVAPGKYDAKMRKFVLI